MFACVILDGVVPDRTLAVIWWMSCLRHFVTSWPPCVGEQNGRCCMTWWSDGFGALSQDGMGFLPCLLKSLRLSRGTLSEIGVCLGHVRWTTYVQVAAVRERHVLLLRSHGSAVSFRQGVAARPRVSQGRSLRRSPRARYCCAPTASQSPSAGTAPVGATWSPGRHAQITRGSLHMVLNGSDGGAAAFGYNRTGQREVHEPELGAVFVQVALGAYDIVLLSSDGQAVAVGGNAEGQFNVLVACAQVATGVAR